MREIKFRAWVKSDKRMITDKQDFIPLIVTNKGVMKLQPQFEASYYEILPNEWFELMQYAGLKDKNGVEIYEGDVVCMHNFYGGFEDKIDVIGIVGINEMGTYTETEDDKLFWLNYWVEPEEELEVIGNIYENQELIKESKHE